MILKETKEEILAERVIDGWNSRQPEIILSMYSPDYELEDITAGRIRHGWEGLHQWIKSVFSAFPNLSYSLLDYVEKDDQLVLHWVAKGHHHGPLMKIPATGKAVEMNGMSILTLKDGKFIKGKVIWDMAGLLRQIGLLPQISY
jgi:steroid delta-isomerase-like uncharacterized protein